jgi:hypothetical protein
MMGAWRAPGCNRIGRAVLATVEVFGDLPARSMRGLPKRSGQDDAWPLR